MKPFKQDSLPRVFSSIFITPKANKEARSLLLSSRHGPLEISKTVPLFMGRHTMVSGTYEPRDKSKKSVNILVQLPLYGARSNLIFLGEEQIPQRYHVWENENLGLKAR